MYWPPRADKEFKEVTPTNVILVMHNKAQVRPKGSAWLIIERNGHAYKANFTVVPGKVTPLLSLKSSQQMGLVKIMDCDTVTSQSLSTLKEQNDRLTVVRTDEILRRYSDVFENLGCLRGEYSIELYKEATPSVNPPRKTPAPLREAAGKELDRLTKEDIIAQVTEPTEWVSSMVTVRKKNGQVRICLDPKELNKAMKRSHYPTPTIEKVATRLTKAKVFTVLDAKSGFWQIKLDEKSSYLTTFQTAFGRYRWLRMPFGIASAPEIWQRNGHQIIEGLNGVEVIADDFLIIVFGDTMSEATESHDRNLSAFLDRCRERNSKLTPDKVKLRLTEIPYIEHKLTAHGVQPDPSKVEAIVHMPMPTDTTSLKRALGMVTYLSKFLPRLSEVCEVLRQLDHKGVAWHWQEEHAKAWEEVKRLTTMTPVLAYYDVNKETTIQCDASSTGLGATLLQEGKPVCFASRALTTSERNSAQIEKELLAILFGCERFDQYIYAKHTTVESDHKPLEDITRKPMADVPKRLQRMLIRLQRYDIQLSHVQKRVRNVPSGCSFPRVFERYSYRQRLAE